MLPWARRSLVVVDGQEGPRYDALVADSLRFSPDSQRVAYGARQGKQWSVMLMGSPGQLYDGIGAGSLVFSPNGQRLAYVAQVGKQQVVVVDGQASKPYKGIAAGSLAFSADSQHVAYAANDEEEDTWFVGAGWPGRQTSTKPGSRVLSSAPTASAWPTPPPWMRRNRWWWSMAVEQGV